MEIAGFDGHFMVNVCVDVLPAELPYPHRRLHHVSKAIHICTMDTVTDYNSLHY